MKRDSKAPSHPPASEALLISKSQREIEMKVSTINQKAEEEDNALGRKDGLGKHKF